MIELDTRDDDIGEPLVPPERDSAPSSIYSADGATLRDGGGAAYIPRSHSDIHETPEEFDIDAPRSSISKRSHPGSELVRLTSGASISVKMETMPPPTMSLPADDDPAEPGDDGWLVQNVQPQAARPIQTRFNQQGVNDISERRADASGHGGVEALKSGTQWTPLSSYSPRVRKMVIAVLLLYIALAAMSLVAIVKISRVAL